MWSKIQRLSKNILQTRFQLIIFPPFKWSAIKLIPGVEISPNEIKHTSSPSILHSVKNFLALKSLSSSWQDEKNQYTWVFLSSYTKVGPNTNIRITFGSPGTCPKLRTYFRQYPNCLLGLGAIAFECCSC